MRKLVSLGAVLFFLLGIAVFIQPAGALPPCSCIGCASRPTGRCINWDEGGVGFNCSDYIEISCAGLSAPATDKVAAEPEFFPLELLGVPAPETRLFPMLPVAKPGC